MDGGARDASITRIADEIQSNNKLNGKEPYHYWL
jgi:hypothetical protein